MSNATRHNKNKVDLSLLPTEACIEECKVWEFGAKVYGRSNWEKLWGDKTVEVVLASMLRHIAALKRGEYYDPESGEQHAGHIRCNAAMLIRYVNQLEKGVE